MAISGFSIFGGYKIALLTNDDIFTHKFYCSRAIPSVNQALRSCTMAFNALEPKSADGTKRMEV